MVSSWFRSNLLDFTTRVSGISLLLLITVYPVAAEDGESATTVSVSETFDGKPFEYRVKSVAGKSGFSVHFLTYPSPIVTDVPQNNTVPAELFLPDGYADWASPRPAVICMHILDGNFELVRMTCSMLASRGIPAMMFKLPYYGQRSPEGGTRSLARQPRRFVQALEQAEAEVHRAVDLLASRPEVDADHIGITGISLGGIVAATAAAEDPRLGRAMLVLAGGDLPAIVHHARETRELSETIRGLPQAEQAEIETALRAVDPLTHAAKLRERAEAGHVVMVNASNDNVVPQACTRRLAQALGIEDRVVWLEGLGHYTAMAAMPATLERTVAFFAADLPGDTRMDVAVESPTGVQVAMGFLRDVAALLGDTPPEGRCHVVDLSISVGNTSGEQSSAADLFVARDSKGCFKVDAKGDEFGRIAFGAAPEVWLLAKNTVLAGTRGTESNGGPPAILGEDDLTKIRTVAGALKAATLAPGVFEQLFAVAEEVADDGQQILHVARQGGSTDRLRLWIGKDRKRIQVLQIEWGSSRATIRIKAFEVNAPSHDMLFRPAEAERTQQVPGDDLLAIFRAVVDFAMHQAESAL